MKFLDNVGYTLKEKEKETEIAGSGAVNAA